ncbi:MAG TPA: group 1 glycosyl transferase [Verrucomicrobia bacterium]|nr:MAG: hypothetical protein A2X46_08785 [Lentisphaerae bacterium GWF2_57_35]HBA82741.1 group 1 glycosyl transferase [Verrucomicrobiota bacterium]
MKILMVNKFFSRKGGSEAYMFDLADLLRSSGHQIIFFSMHDVGNDKSEYAKFFVSNVNFNANSGRRLNHLRAAFRLLYSLEAQRKLKALLEQERPDVAHLHNYNFQITPSILKVLKQFNVPIVWTLHDYKIICPNYKLFTQGTVCDRCKKQRYYECVRNRCMKNSRTKSLLAMAEMYLHRCVLRSYDLIDVFIAPSRFLARISGEWGIDRQRMIQLYNFVDSARFAWADLSLGEGLVYFGRLMEEKGLLVLLQAVKALPHINLVVVGEGPEKEKIQQYIHENNMTNVKMAGFKKGEDLYRLVHQARLVIVPSLWHENNPISVLEAFAMGKAVIASDLGGLPELIQNGQNGFLFPAGDAQSLQATILDLYNDTDTILCMQKRARSFVEKNFSVDLHCKAIEQVYRKILA